MSFAHYKYIREIVEHPLNSSHMARTIRRYLSWNVGRRLLDEADYVIELLPGVRVLLSNQENYATLAYTCGLYDFEDMMFVLHLLRAGDHFGDFGANVGVYSVLAGSTGASVLAVEPVPRTFERLRVNFRMNDVHGTPVNCGLADKRGRLHFTTVRGGMNKVARDAEIDTVEVDVRTADDLASETGLSPCLLKIDVEGYEKPLLDGADNILSTSVVAVIVEMNESGREYGYSDALVHAMLVDYGFEMYRYDARARKLSSPAEVRRHGFNTLFVKRDEMQFVRRRLIEADPVELAIGRV